MRKTALALVAAFVACTALVALGQDKSVNVGWVYVNTVKPGMTKQFEEGRKRHMEWHKKQNDTWQWEMWEVLTGDHAGSYLSVTFGHTYQDLDTWEQKLGAADTADVETNMAPYLASTTGSIWMLEKDSSRLWTGQMPKMAEVSHFLLKPGKEADFEDSIKKTNDAINKSNWPPHYAWFSLVDGGEQPHYVLVYYMNGWADFAEPQPSFDVMMEKAVGKHDAEALTHEFDNSIHKEWSETIRFRSELSYMPAK
jgi:hypothetical protein